MAGPQKTQVFSVGGRGAGSIPHAILTMTIGGVSARSRWMRSTNASLPFRKCSIHTEVSMSTLIAGPMLPPLHGDAGHPESEALRCRARQGACLLAHARRF